MKTLAGILVAAAAVLTACGAMYEEGGLQQSEQMLSGKDSQAGDPTILAAKDCSVSIQCADGTSRSCSGTGGSCSASGGGDGSVTCNGTSYACPQTIDCSANGVCNFSCASDPDCTFCQGGKLCTTNAQCGIDGVCSNRRCLCF